MSVDDELTTPILHSDDDDHENLQNFNDDELKPENAFGEGCSNPSSAGHRFIALLLMCLMGFGEYFQYFRLLNSIQIQK